MTSCGKTVISKTVSTEFFMVELYKLFKLIRLFKLLRMQGLGGLGTVGYFRVLVH